MKTFAIIILIFSSMAVNAQIPMDLKEKLSQGANEVYGSYCGIVGQHPPNRITIEKWIEAEDLSRIYGWLYSPNIVRQAYAAEALIRLTNEKKIDVIEDKAISLIVQLKNSEEMIPTCSGCVYSKMTVAKILDDWDFE